MIEKTPDYNRELLLADFKKRGYVVEITILREYAAKIAVRATATVEDCKLIPVLILNGMTSNVSMLRRPGSAESEEEYPVRRIVGRRALFVFTLLMILSASLSSQVLNEEFLQSSKWCPSMGSFGFWLTISSDGQYKISFVGEGGGQFISGHYVLKEEGLELHIRDINANGFLPSELQEPITYWKLIQDESNIKYEYRIESDTGYSFWRKESERMAGSEIVFQNHEVIRVEEKDRVLQYNSRIRTGPGQGFEHEQFILVRRNSPYREYDELDHLPEGYTITTLARSKTLVEIGEWNDYWYYCDLNLGWYDDGSRHGWIYGALLEQ